MLEEIRQKLEDEIELLVTELNVELPEIIRKAVELGDLRENAEYKSALERQVFVQARLNHLSQRMQEISNIDLKAMPADRVGFGSTVKVRDFHLDEEVTFTIVTGDFMDLDRGHISMASPIGKGLMGARQDEEVTVELPVGPRKFRIVELRTLSQQLEEKK
jgi:transcription elongation factor GreA